MGNCDSIQESNVHHPRLGRVTQILIRNHSWSQKYQRLFDYETTDVHSCVIKVEGDAIIIKRNGKYLLLQNRQFLEQPQAARYAVFRLIRHDNYYELIPINYLLHNQHVQKPLWLVVKSLPQESYSLRERDTLKLGKQKIKIKEITTADYHLVLTQIDQIRVSKIAYDCLEFDNSKPNEQVDCSTKTVDATEPLLTAKSHISPVDIYLSNSIVLPKCESEDICRICLQIGQLNNPLIRPCKCIGTVGYVHLLCLRAWLTKQINAVVTPFCVTIEWKSLVCQMCKQRYKYKIYLDNKKYYTVDIPRPEPPYIMMEIVRPELPFKILKFISFSQRKFITIGRKKEVDVRISEDISVSRIHSIISYDKEKNQFLLTDNNSKFGTLVLARNGIIVRPNHINISLQIGAQLYCFQALRAQSQVKVANYEVKDTYLLQDTSVIYEQDENQNQSQEQDQLGIQQEEQPSPSARNSPEVERPIANT